MWCGGARRRLSAASARCSGRGGGCWVREVMWTTRRMPRQMCGGDAWTHLYNTAHSAARAVCRCQSVRGESAQSTVAARHVASKKTNGISCDRPYRRRLNKMVFAHLEVCFLSRACCYISAYHTLHNLHLFTCLTHFPHHFPRRLLLSSL